MYLIISREIISYVVAVKGCPVLLWFDSFCVFLQSFVLHQWLDNCLLHEEKIINLKEMGLKKLAI